MEYESNRAGPPPPKEIASVVVLGARLTWFLLGPVLLLFLLYGIATSDGGWFTALDALFAIIVILMIEGRWVDVRSPSAKTALGEPATPRHFSRYSAGLLMLTLAAWVAANVVGNHI